MYKLQTQATQVVLFIITINKQTMKQKRFQKLLLINFLSKNPNLDKSKTYILPIRNEDLTNLDDIFSTYYISYDKKWNIKLEY